MSHPISIAQLSALDASPAELIDIAARCGCQFVGLRLLPVTAEEAPSPLVGNQQLRRDVAARARDAAVGVLDIEVFRLTPEVTVANWEPALAAASELGARHLLTQVHDPNQQRALDRFGEFCALAASYQLTCDIEFLTWTEMRDLESVRRFLVGAGQANGGICIDTLHFWRSRCRLAEIEQLPAEWVRYVQVADGRGPRDVSAAEMIRVAREERALPGAGEIDLRGIIARVSPDTPLALEIPNVQLARRLSPEDRLRLARTKLIELLSTLEAAAA